MRLGAVALDVMAVSRAPLAAVAARQSARLATVIAAAQRGSSLYRERFHGIDARAASLSMLPFVSRGELMHRFDEWVTDPLLKLEDLRSFTADPKRCGSAFRGKYMAWESSGTSGQPGIFVQDAQTMAVYDALESLRRHAPQPLARWMDPACLTERTAFVGATGGHFASYVTLERLRKINPWLAPRLRSFSILQPVDALVAELNAFAPTVIATYPTAAALLADEAQRGNLTVDVREVWTGGENLNPVTREHVQRALGCAVRNSYGASEFLSMGWECAAGHLHVNADWVILEPVDAHYQPVPLGQASHTVLLTHLANTVQPLIRYELGDQITLDPNPCACGVTLPVIHVQGRNDRPLMMAGRQGQTVTFLPLALMMVLEDQAGVFDFQLRQKDARTLVLRLGLQGGEAVAAMARCRAALKSYATTQGLAPIRLLEELGQPLLRGRSGKVCRVIAMGA